ncbi:hypothetical protein DFH09DRAFT_1344907 [Mycena vulgaris]|nr:hypothetical protein DFH09DRAFT_1344907 [Mycena vulgaris]
MSGDGDEGPASPPPERPARSTPPIPKPPHIVDFEPDEEDQWVDEDQHLKGLGTTTHRSRNRGKPTIAIRKKCRHVPGPVTRRDAETRAERAGKRRDFAADVAAWEVEREEHAHELAERHGMKVKEVRRRMLSGTAFKQSRKPSLYNAKISRIMLDMNKGLDLGNRHKLKDIKQMVCDDPSLLEGFTEEEEAEMLEELGEKRKTKTQGARANNLAAGADVRCTIARMASEITALAERAGMMGFAMFTRGHIHDRTLPVSIQSWGALDFFREMMKKEPTDIASMFELWAINREKGITGANTLDEMQKECTELIISGLRTILMKTKVKMNWENYIRQIVERLNVGLVGWPDGVDFKQMSKQSAMGPLRTLLDALQCGTCKWKRLTAGEKKRLVAQFEEMVERGEAREKVAKPRAAKLSGGVRAQPKKKATRDDDSGEDDDEAPRAKSTKATKAKASSRVTRSKQSTAPKVSAARVKPRKGTRYDDDDDAPLPANSKKTKCIARRKPSEDEEEHPPRKAISSMTVQEKRKRLEGLVAKARKAGTGGKGERGVTKGSKRGRDEGEEAGGARKKAKSRAGDEGGSTSVKRKRGADDEGEVVRKKKKDASDRAQPAPVLPRPKPRLKAKLTTTTSGAPSTTNVATADAPASHAPTTADAPTATVDPATADAHTPNPNAMRSTSAASTSGKRAMVKGKAGGPPGIR